LTDQPYVDFDGDWIAEVPITRWPARWTDELWLIAHQMQQYDAAVGMGQDDYDAYFFVGDDSASSGAFAAESYQEVVDEVVVPGYRTCWESSFQGHAAVVAGAIDFWNEHGDPNLQVAPPELVTIISRTSNANNLGGIFDGEGGAPLFAVEDLCVCGSQPPLWLAASCHGADFGTSESLLDGTPLCELLGLYGRAIGVIGPTMGSSQIANREVAKSVVGRLYEDPSRPMATSVFSALREVADGGYGSEYRIAVTLRSYCMIGNPVSRFSPGNYSVVGAPVATQPTVTESDVLLAWPNPSRSGTTIAVRSSDLDAVEIRIVDVSGRAIRTLRLDGATSKEVFWDHKDGRGLVVSPGVYWAHGKVRNRRVNRPGFSDGLVT
jgi:hypothetical protein